MKMKAYFTLILTLAFLMTVSGCVSNTPATNTAATTSAASTSFEPTETAAVATPTPTPAMLETVVTLPVPATYASLYDGLKLYSDGSRATILKTLVKGEQVTITGTAGQYGVTADGAYINLHLMIDVVTVTATPTPAETSAAPTDPTTATTAKPTTTSAPKPTPTPKPTATPAPTAVPVATLSASEVEALVWTQVESARSGFTTNHSDVLSAKCRIHASSYTIGHPGRSGSLESCGGISQRLNGEWTVQLTAGYTNFVSLTDAVNAMSRELVTDHVPLMATTADYTEFGVGVAKQEPTAAYPLTTYYVYISCAKPDELAYQISAGWYD